MLAEGNVFESVEKPVEDGVEYLFAALTESANAVCQSPLGYVCQVNQLTGSGDWAGSATDFIKGFSGEGVKAVAASTVAASVKSKAGVGKL